VGKGCDSIYAFVRNIAILIKNHYTSTPAVSKYDNKSFSGKYFPRFASLSISDPYSIYLSHPIPVSWKSILK
jgi:hypothetical protein